MAAIQPDLSLSIEALSPAAIDEARALFGRCGDYIRIVTGLPPDDSEAERLFTDAPPNRDPSDKDVWAIRRAGAPLVGVIEVMKGYPGATHWFIGLLLLDPAWRGQHIGAEAVAFVVQRARDSGITELHIGVLPGNAGALRFWRREGFRELRLARQLGVEENIPTIVLNRRLGEMHAGKEGGIGGDV